MKKFLSLTPFLIFLISVTSCYAQNKSSKTPANVINVDEAYFIKNIYDYESNPNQFVYKGTTPAIIDFYATWCGPCRALAPKLKKMAEKYGSDLVVYKIDIDKNQKLATTFGVTSVPTMLFVPLNETPYLSSGNLPESAIEEMIQKILPKNGDYEKKK